MRIGIYSPYLDSFGGGERYVLTVAKVLSENHQVDLLLDRHQLSLDPQNLKVQLGKRLSLNLSKVHLVKAPVGEGSNFFKRLFFLRAYDLVFYLTDGSIFYSTAKHSVIHFQVPFKNITAHSLWGRFKLSSWQLAICNSEFTKNLVAAEWPIKCQTLYPPVDIEAFKPLKKKKYILSVGRFASFTKSKKHEEMICAFAGLFKTGKIKDWSLYLAGSIEGDKKYPDELKKLSEGLPIFFYPDLPFKKLVTLYGESSIYWHAAGFGEDDPAKMEHFGISTVEAMAAGCVPVVINKGGQVEIVENGKSGFLWNSPEELKEITLKLINNPKLMLTLSKNAQTKSKLFSKKHFAEKIQKMILFL